MTYDEAMSNREYLDWLGTATDEEIAENIANTLSSIDIKE